MKSLQLDSPHAIVVIGIQGSGKSFFAQKFAETFKAPYLDESVFNAVARDADSAVRLFVDVLQEMLKTGRSIVLERAQSSRTDRTELTKQLKAAGYTPIFVWVQTDVETAMTRSYKLYRMTEDEHKASMRGFSPPHASEKTLVISGKHTFATQAKIVLKKLSGARQLDTPQSRPQPSRGQIIVR